MVIVPIKVQHQGRLYDVKLNLDSIELNWIEFVWIWTVNKDEVQENDSQGMPDWAGGMYKDCKVCEAKTSVLKCRVKEHFDEYEAGDRQGQF